MNYPYNAHFGFKMLAAAWMWVSMAHLTAIRDSNQRIATELSVQRIAAKNHN